MNRERSSSARHERSAGGHNLLERKREGMIGHGGGGCGGVHLPVQVQLQQVWRSRYFHQHVCALTAKVD